jgi:hypothetical protein
VQKRPVFRQKHFAQNPLFACYGGDERDVTVNATQKTSDVTVNVTVKT